MPFEDRSQVGWSVKDLDIIEANEAFAAQAVAVNKVRRRTLTGCVLSCPMAGDGMGHIQSQRQWRCPLPLAIALQPHCFGLTTGVPRQLPSATPSERRAAASLQLAAKTFYAWPCMDFCLFLLGGLDSRNETHQQVSRPCDTLHWWWSRWEHSSPKQQHDIVKHRHLRNEVASVFRQEWRCASSVLSPANFEQPKAFCCLQQRNFP